MKTINTFAGDIIHLDLNEDIDISKYKENGNYYFIKNTKIWILSINEYHKALLPYDGENPEEFIDSLLGKKKTKKKDDEKEKIGEIEVTSYPKMSGKDFGLVMKYFREVFNKHQSEAGCLLMTNKNKDKIIPFFVMQYDFSISGVQYIQPSSEYDDKEINDILEDKDNKKIHSSMMKKYNKLYGEGYRICGTIHSHANFEAFHSGVDDSDEESFDGFHITIGNVDDDKWTYSQRYALRGYFVDIENINDMLDTKIKLIEKTIDDIKIPEWMMNLMIETVKPTYSWTPSNNRSHIGRYRNNRTEKSNPINGIPYDMYGSNNRGNNNRGIDEYYGRSYPGNAYGAKETDIRKCIVNGELDLDELLSEHPFFTDDISSKIILIDKENDSTIAIDEEFYDMHKKEIGKCKNITVTKT